MPNLPDPHYYPSWTSCCTDPATQWISQDQVIKNMTAMLGVGGIIGASTVGVLFEIIGLGIEESIIPGGGLFFLTACAAGIYYCNWWLNIRLICLGGDRGALGAVYNVEPPTPSLGFWNLGDYDTDYSFDLLLYAATPADVLPGDFASNYSPPQPWSANPKNHLEAQWSSLFPTIDWDHGNLILPQIHRMGMLGLGFTGQTVQYPTPVVIANPPPLQQINITPTSVTVTNGSDSQFLATAIYADDSSQDVTNTITWSSSS